MSCFAIYRLPGAAECTLMEQDGEPRELRSCVELNGQSGFVLAPFAVSDRTPLLLLEPDRVALLPSPQGGENPMWEALALRSSANLSETSPVGGDGRGAYTIDFANYHAQLCEGRFQKLVLARNAFVEEPAKEPLALFRKACDLYPQAFVALVSTSQSGTWLMATPEILVEGKGQAWHTMALAGTIEAPQPPKGESEYPCSSHQTPPLGGVRLWSSKNIEEQQLVATYIMQCLEQFASDIHEEGPVTVQAANVMHLRSDFHFTLPYPEVLGMLLQKLHPTPAVCGLPKAEAQDFILHNEAAERRYYSGFCGPLNMKEESHLFVSLRCMELFANGYRLYAGGGLLPESQMQQEWDETEAKMQAMRQLIR